MNSKKPCILVIDDEDCILSLLKDYLKALGYDSVRYTTAIDALTAFRIQPDHFDLVLTDLNMPFCSGWDVAKMIGKIRTDVPVILMTGNPQDIDPVSIDAEIVKAVIYKPLCFKSVKGPLRDLLKKAELQ